MMLVGFRSFFNLRIVSAAMPAAILACVPMARAAERLTLANGFDVVCDHHAVVDGHFRVFLNPAQPDYFELQASAVTDVETLPDSAMAHEASGMGGAAVHAAKDAVAASVIGRTVSARATGEKSSGARAGDVQLSAADLHLLLSKAGNEHNVDEDLLASLVKAESNGHTRATSRTGARGLMQLMPGTAQQLGVNDSFAPDENVRGGTAYLDSLLTRYHDSITLAVAAYNAGPAAVDRYHGIPPYRETRIYVARVVHEFNRRVIERQRLARMNLASGLNATSLGAMQ